MGSGCIAARTQSPVNAGLQGIEDGVEAVVCWCSRRFGHLEVSLPENTRIKKKPVNVSWQGLYSSPKLTM